jgi:hypothetical protein
LFYLLFSVPSVFSVLQTPNIVAFSTMFCGREKAGQAPPLNALTRRFVVLSLCRFVALVAADGRAVVHLN